MQRGCAVDERDAATKRLSNGTASGVAYSVFSIEPSLEVRVGVGLGVVAAVRELCEKRIVTSSLKQTLNKFWKLPRRCVLDPYLLIAPIVLIFIFIFAAFVLVFAVRVSFAERAAEADTIGERVEALQQRADADHFVYERASGGEAHTGGHRMWAASSRSAKVRAYFSSNARSEREACPGAHEFIAMATIQSSQLRLFQRMRESELAERSCVFCTGEEVGSSAVQSARATLENELGDDR